MSSEPLDHWLAKIESIHPEEVELGLERVSAVAEKLGLLPVAQPVVTVAGTNGKGSVVAVLEALLVETGFSTGAFTSPHFIRFNERIRLSGVEAADDDIVLAFEAIEAAREGVPLTYFEFTTLAALLVFKANSPDIVILEVGLGGRLDAVNMVNPAVAVITSIDLDHQAWLGDTRGTIAREKAGIMRRGTPVVIGEPEPPTELEEAVHEVEASPAFFIGRDFSAAMTGGEWRGELRTSDGTTRRFAARCTSGLLAENIGTALQAALLLGVNFDASQLEASLSKAAPTGRRELRYAAGREYVLDVAHNPAAVAKLLEYIALTPCNGKTIAIFSIMADKDIRAVVDTAAGHFDAWFLAEQPGNSRAAQAADVAALLNGAGQSMISISKNLRQALRRAESVSGEGDRLVVFGSFYTVAGVLPLLDRNANRNRNGAP